MKILWLGQWPWCDDVDDRVGDDDDGDVDDDGNDDGDDDDALQNISYQANDESGLNFTAVFTTTTPLKCI